MNVWATICCDYQGHDGFPESVGSLNLTLEGALASWYSTYLDLTEYPELQHRDDSDCNYAWIIEKDESWSLYGRTWSREPDLRLELIEVGP